MEALTYIVAIAAAAAVTSIVLWYRHGRHPFGDSHNRALIWWLAIVILDSLIAVLLLTGSIALASFDQLSNVGDIVRSVAIGILGPLGIRSPVREVSVGGKPEKVGITTVYDKVWIFCDRRLDEQLTLLRRSDREQILSDIRALGWTSTRLLNRLKEHVSELKSPSEVEKKAIVARAEQVLTLPTEDKKLRALIVVMTDERLNSLIRYCRERGPGARSFDID